jgi:transcriptional regulator with XRE-family HTH domain
MRPMDVPHAIRQLRAALSANQSELAQRLGLSIRAIANYEGGRIPKSAVLQRLIALARKAERADLAAVFAAALQGGMEEYLASVAEERVWSDAVAALVRGKESKHWPRVQRSIVTALESLRRQPSWANDEQLAGVLLEARYRLSDTAERKLSDLAKARQSATGEPYFQAYSTILLQNPQLYEQYQLQRARAARGTPFEKTMALPYAGRSKKTKP